MEVVTGALPSLLPKLGQLLISEYNLQREVMEGIKFLQAELESMKGALEKISTTPVDRNVRELSYDIEDRIDTFMMVHCKGRMKPAKQRGFKKVIDTTLNLLMQPKIRHKIATDIRDIKCHVEEVSKRRDRYSISCDVVKHASVDPRLFARYEKATEFIGINEAREELIQILMEGNNEVSKQQNKILSIVGFGGLGKTTLATAVYEKLRAQFDCSAFVSVTQNPDSKKLFKDMLYQVAGEKNASVNVIRELREFLQKKRYFIVIDDVWDISSWKMIKCALPDSNIGYKIILTTRILKVAEQAGGPYKLKPLSLSNSRKLLYRRIFGNENKGNNDDTEKCLNEELDEVSDRILKKCAGVPLAINTMASILACKAINKLDWYEVHNSIGTGLENNLDVENMRKILSLSYYDMPSHLRTFLLYLSLFPEDCKIEKDRLIRMWVAEGFIQCDKQGKSLFELGESYFNELINRSMIQPVHNRYTNIVEKCHIHDMVLDLIRYLSSEQNFVTILNGMEHKYPSNTIRRLSLQNGKEDRAMTLATRSLQQVRSAFIFPSPVGLIPVLRKFQVLRVLDLHGCDLSQGYTLKYLGNLFHLRYLRLYGTRISHLPEEIENIQLLQTLDVRGNNISSLPSTIVQLKHLRCLCIDESTRVPYRIGSLTSLEELICLRIDNFAVDIIEELGQLTELRVLHILFSEWNGKLVECLRKLQKIQFLKVNSFRRNISGLDAWVAPRRLHRLDIRCCSWFSTLPHWINPSLLLDLTFVAIAIRELQQDDLEVLGRLPALRCLDLLVDHEDLGILNGFVVGSGLFPCLVYCEFQGFVGPVVFQQGVMPRLTTLDLQLFVAGVREITSSHGGLDMGLSNLLSLQHVWVHMCYDGSSRKEAEQVKAALRHAAEIHPNHPTLRI